MIRGSPVTVSSLFLGCLSLSLSLSPSPLLYTVQTGQDTTVYSVYILHTFIMLLREAVLQDLPFIADVAAQAMFDDELFDIICPKRHEYYSDYRDGFMRRLQVKLATPGWVVMVAENSGLVVGYSVWERIGDTKSARRWMELKEGLKSREFPC